MERRFSGRTARHVFLIVTILITTFAVWPSAVDGGYVSTADVKQEQGTGTGLSSSFGIVGQSFVPTRSGVLTQIDVHTAAKPNHTITLYAADSSGLPTGTALASGVLRNPVTVPSRWSAWESFAFATPAHVTAGTQYAWVLASSQGAGFETSTQNPYPGGFAFGGSQIGSLTSFTGEDALFRTYVAVEDSTAPGVTVTVDADDQQAPNFWYNTASSGTDGVTLHVAATDTNGIAGIVCTNANTGVELYRVNASSGSFTLSNGTYAVVCTASDTADPANEGTSDPLVLQIEQTAPTIQHLSNRDVCTFTGVNGWCRGEMDVSYRVESAVSSIVGTDNQRVIERTVRLSENGNAVTHATGQFCSRAGNCNAGITIGPYKIDSVAPTMNPSISPSVLTRGMQATANANATDSLSGIASQSCDPVDTSSVGTTNVTCRAADNAGNTSERTIQVQIGQAVPPTISVTVDDDDQVDAETGWYNIESSGTDGVRVDVAASHSNGIGSITCTNEIGGAILHTADTATTTFTLSGNGRYVLRCTASEAGAPGNTTSNESVILLVEQTLPEVTFNAENGTCSLAGDNGWCRDQIRIDYSIQSFSTIPSPPANLPPLQNSYVVVAFLETNGAAVSYTTSSFCSGAGNCHPGIASGPYKIDSVDPTLAPTVSPTVVTVGSTATVTPNALDVTSGIAGQSCDAVNTSSAGTKTIICRATDNAGNTTETTIEVRVVDGTKPLITPTVTGTQGTDGWYTSDVTVSWSVVDDESTITASNGCDATTIASDTDGTTLTCTATSEGGTSSASVTITRDATPPSLAPSITPNSVVQHAAASANANASDATSGIVNSSCGTLDTSTVGTKTVTCTATDTAGNMTTASATYSVVYRASVAELYDELRAYLSSTDLSGRRLTTLISWIDTSERYWERRFPFVPQLFLMKVHDKLPEYRASGKTPGLTTAEIQHARAIIYEILSQIGFPKRS